MKRLVDLLEDDFATPDACLALELAREDQHMLGQLVEYRRARGLTQADVAKSLGLTQATVSAFERPGNDPRLSTVRRYCRAIGVIVRHLVDDRDEHCGEAGFMSHVGPSGVYTAETATSIAKMLDASAKAWPQPSGTIPTTSLAKLSR